MASSGRPGFFDSFRVGWAPAKRVGGSARKARPAAGGTAAGRTAAGGTAVRPPKGRPARKQRPGGKGARGPAADGAAASRRAASPQLLKRKDELARQYARLQWDLGGITYEMARRDHYRLEVLNAQAAKLQEVDAELGQLERLVKLDEAGAAGDCPHCGALQARGAHYCWRCGKEITPAAEGADAAAAAGTGSAATPQPAPESKPPPPAKTIAKPAAKRRASRSRRRTASKGKRT